MKKLNNKQLKTIKAGKGLTGALLDGISHIIKSAFDGLTEIGSMIGGFILGSKELNKNHDKMSLKVGNSQLSFDDTASVNNRGHLDLENAKNAKLVTGVGTPKSIPAPKLETHDLAHTSNIVETHDLVIDSNHDVSMFAIDDFMHF